MLFELLFLLAACILGGLALLLWSWLDRRKRDWLAGIVEVGLGEAQFGMTSAVNGVSDAPALHASPVSQSPCVFYEKQTDVQYTNRPHADDVGNALAMGINLAERMVWVRESVESMGGFFLTDGSAKSFVFPHGATLRVNASRIKSAQDPDVVTTRRITERFIPNGQTVCVIGRPRTVEELLAVVRENANIAPETLRRLKESGPMSCYFADGKGTFVVADMLFTDLKADAAESAGSLFWAGLGMLGIGVFIAIIMVLTMLNIL